MRRASCATQATPVSGAQVQRWRSIRREQTARAAPRMPVPSASSAERNSQGHWPTCVEDQARSGMKNAMPYTKPMPRPPRRRLRWTAAPNPATDTAASGQAP